MDYEFDAPQFFDFAKPEQYEHVYDDTWFDRHLEDDLPVEEENAPTSSNSRKARRSHQSGAIPNKPLRVLKQTAPVPQDESGVFLEEPGSRSSGESSSLKPSQRAPLTDKQNQLNADSSSPKKKQRLSTESQQIKEEIADTSPAANTRSRTRASCEGKSSPSISLQNDHIHQSVNLNIEKPISDEQCNVESLTSKSPQSNSVVSSEMNLRKSPRKVVRSPRKAMKSPYKAPKDCGSPIKRNLNTASSLLKNSVGQIFKSGKALKRSASNASSKKPVSEMKKMGSTPNLKKMGSTPNLKAKTTEQMELEKIQDMKKELAKTKKQSKDSYKKAMTSTGYMPVRSNAPVTLPEGFHFQTDRRLKNQSQNPKDSTAKDFTKCLRDALPHSNQQAPKLMSTRPQPFKLSTSKSAAQIEKYQSAAEKIAAFHKQTPERFRTHPRGGRPITRSGSFSKTASGGKRDPSPGLTVAKTPNFATRGRSRPVHAPTREEKEQMEFEEHQKQQFKAHPINHKILEKGPSLSKVPAKAVTVPEEFNLHHKLALSEEDLRSKAEEEEKYEFHAKPVNPKIMKGPVGVKPINPLPITVPQSPAFALKNRIRIPVEVPQAEQPKATGKGSTVLYPGVPFRPRLEHHHTVPEPFTVEERSKQMLTRKEQKIQQILEEEKQAREFHAQEFKEKPDVLPPKVEKAPTCPEPFHLSADERGQRYKEEFFSKQVEEEQRQAKKAAEFKARPNNVTHKDPFQPQKSNKPLTEISDFALNTDVRAGQRDAFEKFKKEKEAEIAGIRREREERIEQQNKEEVAKMRQEAVHKAQGVKKYKPVTVKPSDKPLTDAHSPCFSQRTRRHNISDV